MAVVKVERTVYGIDEWRAVVKSAGQYLIDHADEFIADAEKARSVIVTLECTALEMPQLSVNKTYNVLEMAEFKPRENKT